MKNAMLLIPSNLNEKVNTQEYLDICIRKAAEMDYIPLTPDIYQIFTNTLKEVYINMYLPKIDAVLLFIDYGMDEPMLSIIERCKSEGKECISLRCSDMDLFKCFSTPIQILHEVSRALNIPVELMMSKRKPQKIVDARYVYFRRAKEKTKATLDEIGLLVGKDHASVLHGIREANNTWPVIKKYEECYGKAKIKAASMEHKAGSGSSNGIEEKRPVLSHLTLEKTELGVPAAKSIVPEMRTKGVYSALAGYGSCYTKAVV